MKSDPKTRVLFLIIALLSSMVLGGCSGKIYRHQSVEKVDGDEVVRLARSMLGVRYRYGGESPSQGFDCSGLVYYVHQQVGLEVPRTSGGLYKYTLPINRAALKPGDLLFFRTYGRKYVSHVGIYVGNNKFIHAPSSGKRVSIANLNDEYWRKHYTGAGRI